MAMFEVSELGNWRHICVDMQRMFSEDTPWKVPWMQRVSPEVTAVVDRHAERTIFTRFIPPQHAEDMPGTWRDYYRKWWMMTGEHMPTEMTDLAVGLAQYVPPAGIFNKKSYSPWLDGRFHALLTEQRVSTLVVTGGETDVCVLATTLGGIDLGYRMIVLEDAVCSGADETHDASIKLLGDRFSVQLELMSTEALLSIAG
jgi:nicotinamidase-related amidase